MRIFHCTAVYGPNSFIIRCIILAIFAAAQAVQIFCYLLPLYKANTKSTSIIFYVMTSIWCTLSLLWIWSYIVTCWMDAGSVENELYNNGYVDQKGQLIESKPLPPEIASQPRCEKCHLPKPFRTHHCSQCDKCYFRFDHHCDVIGNCVAYNNMKAFMLFLFYSSLLLFFSAITSVVSYTTTKKVELSYLLTSCLLGILLGAVICIFACMYIPEVCVNNRTTLERIAGNEPKMYDAGVGNNIKQVFGECPLLWIFPTRPKVDGFTWSTIYDHNSRVPKVEQSGVLNNYNNTKKYEEELKKKADLESPLIDQHEMFKDEENQNENGVDNEELKTKLNPE